MNARKTLFRSKPEGAVRHILGMIHVNKLLPAEAGYLLLEVTVPPGCGAPPHVHDIDTECFHVLDGELTFIDDEGERVATAGDTCYLPAGLPHGFVNRSTSPVRALVITTPGQAAERFFDDLHQELAQAGPPELAQVAGIAARHSLRLLPGAGQ
jgi:quercetin dioxygenase-like cupin family protein